MNSLELDHIFCFCSPQLHEATIAENVGFRPSRGRQHPGQGTANRCILFQENYLEFIFLESQEDAESNPLKLHRRALWKSTGASPFGIALRGTIPEKDRDQFWEYKPAYLPSGAILVHKENDQANLPLIFIVPPRDGKFGAAMHPKNFPNIDSTLLEHSTHTTKILSVRMAGSSYKWPLSTPVRNVIFEGADKPSMTVTLDGNLRADVALNEILSISGQ